MSEFGYKPSKPGTNFDAETGKALSIRRFRLPEGGGEDALEGLL